MPERNDQTEKDALAERVLALADEWEHHSRSFVAPADRGTREDWEFVARRLREVVAQCVSRPADTGADQ